MSALAPNTNCFRWNQNTNKILYIHTVSISKLVCGKLEGKPFGLEGTASISVRSVSAPLHHSISQAETHRPAADVGTKQIRPAHTHVFGLSVVS